MGADYSSYALIGVRVEASRLYRRQRVKAFRHDYPEDWTHCPKTGRSLWTEENVPMDGYDEDRKTLKGYRVVCGTNRYAYICLAATGEKTYSNGGPMDQKVDILSGEWLEDARNTMKAHLQTLNMWDDNAFGLWAVLCC